jgi:hypothetical protein
VLKSEPATEPTTNNCPSAASRRPGPVADLQHRCTNHSRPPQISPCAHTIRGDDLIASVGMGNNRVRRLGRVRGRLWGEAASSLTIERQGARGMGVAAQLAPTMLPHRSPAIQLLVITTHSFGIGLPQRGELSLCRRLEFIPTAEMISPKFTSVPYQRRHYVRNCQLRAGRIWPDLFVAAVRRPCRTLCVAALAEHYIQHQSFEQLFLAQVHLQLSASSFF